MPSRNMPLCVIRYSRQRSRPRQILLFSWQGEVAKVLEYLSITHSWAMAMTNGFHFLITDWYLDTTDWPNSSSDRERWRWLGRICYVLLCTSISCQSMPKLRNSCILFHFRQAVLEEQKAQKCANYAHSAIINWSCQAGHATKYAPQCQWQQIRRSALKEFWMRTTN